MSLLRHRTAALTAIIGLAGFAAAAHAQSNTFVSVTNTAQLSYSDNGQTRALASNTVSTAVSAVTAPTLHLMRLADGAGGTTLDASDTTCRMGASGAFVPAPTSGDQSFNAAGAVLAAAPSFHVGEPIFIEVQDNNANVDATARDILQLDVKTSNGDHEVLELRETGPDTGLFVGYIATTTAAATPYDCRISAPRGDTVTVNFTDPADASWTASASALIDPYGYVFKSSTGEPVSGATVTLVNDVTGQPAKVFGDDGVSIYPSTVVTGSSVTDSAGTVYPYQAGQYRFPQTAPGRYRLVVTPPAPLVTPSTASQASLAKLSAPDGQAFAISDASFDKAFTLSGSIPLQVDIPADAQSDGLSLEKSASANDASMGDFVQYRLTLKNKDSSAVAEGVKITDALPRGFRYVKGSSRLNGARVADPTTPDGRTLTYTMGALAAGGSSEIDYVTVLDSDAQAGDAINRANATAPGGLSSNAAEALVHVHPPLMTDGATIVGRITDAGCDGDPKARQGVPGVRLLMEDGTYVVTDKDGLYHFEGVRLGSHVVQVDLASLPEGLEPVLCSGGDTRFAGRAFSQFVEVQGGALWRADFHLRTVAGWAAKAKAADTAKDAPVDDVTAAGDHIDWFADKATSAAFVFPLPGHNPRAPTVRAAVRHLPGQKVEITVNGKPVDPFSFDATETSADGKMSVSLWRGLPLLEGDNTLHATVRDAQGAVVAELDRKVHYANVAARAELVEARSHLSADGLSRPVIAVRFLDRAGLPVRAGSMGGFKVSEPYRPALDVERQQARKAAGQDASVTTWRVLGDDGVALIALQPTAHSGSLTLDLPLPNDPANRPTQVRAWLQPDRQDWVVVGFAAGTMGFNTLSRHAEPLARDEGQPGFADAQLSFYAKGRVLGSWLLTMAYDNKKTADKDRGLLGVIDPNQYYAVYGDATGQAADAPSQRKLYLRLERRQFYALFGDFQTGFDATELGRYSRTVNGLKFERAGRVLSFAGFAADTDQTQVRDEIQGSGLSGPYQLSRQDVVANSEQITVETRDRARSERILSSTSLTRYVDYDIDYDTGMLSFSQPVLSHDANQNPNIIVAQYEVTGAGKKALIAGGRVAARLADGRVIAGATYLHDGQGLYQAPTDLIAGDLKLKPRVDTEVRLEAAASNRDATGAIATQTAYIAEIEHRTQADDVLAYYRQQDIAFGLGQQNASEQGARKMGADAKINLGHDFALTATGYHEDYMLTGASRDLLNGRLDYNVGQLNLNAGLEYVHDTTDVAGTADSELLTLGAGHWFLNHKLQLLASTDFSLDGKAASLDFPVRHRLSGTYAFNDSLRLTLSHEIDDGAKFKTQTTALGVEVSPWKGAKLDSGLDQQAITTYGPRTFATFGLAQSLIVGKRWGLDAAVDTSTSLAGAIPVAELVSLNSASTSGGTTYASNLGQAGASVAGSTGSGIGNITEDFKSVSLGAAYRADKWTVNARAEVRLGQTADTWNLTGNYLRQLGGGMTAAASLRASETHTWDGAISAATEVDLSGAWRPLNSRWSMLEKFEVRNDTARGTASDETLSGFGELATSDGQSNRIVNNVAVNYSTDAEHGRGGMQASLYYGAKYVIGQFGTDDYTGFVDAVGLQALYDLNNWLDVGFNVAVQHAWSAGTVNYAAGPQIGVSPAKNTWISLGYNVVGYRDRDFTQSDYTHSGPYVTARLKFDQASLAPLASTLAQFVRGAR